MAKADGQRHIVLDGLCRTQSADRVMAFTALFDRDCAPCLTRRTGGGGFGANEARGGGLALTRRAGGGLALTRRAGGGIGALTRRTGGGGGWHSRDAYSAYKSVHTQGGAHTSRCIHKAVHTQGGAHKRRSVATAGVLLFKGPRARRCT